MSGRRKVTESTGKNKRMPVLKTDEEAEAFLEQDLSDYLWAGNFAPFPYELRPVGKEGTGDKASVRLKPRRQASR
jgi:predicted DNA binding CopG/RHH family protein